MRIALIAPLVTPITEPLLGGAQAVVADLAGALSRRGHDVVLYAARGSAVDGVAMAPVDIDSSRLQTDLFRAGLERECSAAMFAAYRAVYSHVLQGGFAVVHNHGFDAPAVLVAAEMQVAALHTLHLPPEAGIARSLASIRRGRTPVWCAAVSKAHATAWRHLLPVDVVLRNGVPTERIPFQASSARSAVVAARFSVEKGVDDGIAASRAAGWPVDVYGTPYDAAHERIVRQRWADDPEVRFHRPVQRARLWDAVGAAGAVLCLSRWEEPFGMVAAEAQAAGTPVIASRRGGFAEVVQDQATGFLVPPGEVAAAARALLGAPTLSRRACRDHAVRTLSLDVAVDAHEALYAELATQSGVTP